MTVPNERARSVGQVGLVERSETVVAAEAALREGLGQDRRSGGASR